LKKSLQPNFLTLFLLFFISAAEAVISFTGFAVLVFVISGSISKIEFIPPILLTLPYLLGFFIFRFIFSTLIVLLKRNLLFNMSINILKALWKYCDSKPESDLNSRLLSNEILQISMGYQSISVLISELLMTIFIIIGIILNISFNLVTYPILIGTVLTILVILFLIRNYIKYYTELIFTSGSVFADKIKYYYNHFLSISLRKLNSDYKYSTKESYSSFLISVVSKSSLKSFTPIAIETVGIISCLLIVFFSEGLDKIAFIAFVVRLIASFNRVSVAYQGVISKKAIEDKII
jgi:hypothetical protein